MSKKGVKVSQLYLKATMTSLTLNDLATFMGLYTITHLDAIQKDSESIGMISLSLEGGKDARLLLFKLGATFG